MEEEEERERGIGVEMQWRSPSRGIDVRLSFLSQQETPPPPPVLLSLPFAALLVPKGRESDWIFCTDAGHRHLLSSSSVARLAIASRLPPSGSAIGCGDFFAAGRKDGKKKDEDEDRVLKEELSSFLIGNLAMAKFPPGDRFRAVAGVGDGDGDGGVFAASEIPFLDFEDGVVSRVVVEEVFSPLTGGIVVEDVEVASHDVDSHFRRRMRFRRTPNLVQTEVPISIASNANALSTPDPTLLNYRGFVNLDHSRLTHKYLEPIVAGFILASPHLAACRTLFGRVNVLSVGVGGGALPTFLCKKLGFHVDAIELDEIVICLARTHFGLTECPNLHVQVGDGIKILEHIADLVRSQKPCSSMKTRHRTLDSIPDDPRYDIIVLDVDAQDVRCNLSSPPMCFLEKDFLSNARIALRDGGMLALNVVPCSEIAFKTVVKALQTCFLGLYEIKLDNAENHVVFAFPTEIDTIDVDNPMALEIRGAINERLIYEIMEVPR